MGVLRPAAVPINDGAVDAAAGHVRYLLLDFDDIRGDIADVQVVAKPEPGQELRVDLARGTGVQQVPHRHFADVAASDVAVLLRGEAIRGAGVVAGLRRQSGGRLEWRSGRSCKSSKKNEQNELK